MKKWGGMTEKIDENFIEGLREIERMENSRIAEMLYWGKYIGSHLVLMRKRWSRLVFESLEKKKGLDVRVNEEKSS